MKLTITPAVRALGIDVVMAVVSGANVSNKSGPLEKRKKAVIEELTSVDPTTDPILQAYRDLYPPTHHQEYTPPAAHLLGLIGRNGRLPNINTVVDCYNLVSARTRLSVGAHDTAHIEGDLTFRLTDGSELYTPLGETTPVAVEPGEYACLDDHKILCRLDLKQCQQTRITKDTRQFALYVQGNAATDRPYLEAALGEVCDLITEICGGTYEVVTVLA